MLDIKSLTNNRLREQFISEYKEWNVISENEVTGEKIYHYQLDNGAGIAVVTRKCHDYHGNLSERKEEYFLLNVDEYFDGKKYVFTIKNGMTFYDCQQAKHVVVEFLKAYSHGEVVAKE